MIGQALVAKRHVVSDSSKVYSICFSCQHRILHDSRTPVTRTIMHITVCIKSPLSNEDAPDGTSLPANLRRHPPRGGEDSSSGLRPLLGMTSGFCWMGRPRPARECRMRISHGNSLPFCGLSGESLRGKVQWCARRTLARGADASRCVTLLPPSYGVARLSFCARKRERLLLHGMNSSEKRLAHPWNRNGPLTAKAPFLLLSLQRKAVLIPFYRHK